MVTRVTTLQALVTPSAPALPLAPVGYDQRFTDAVNNILRQYFLTLQNTLGSAFGEQGGQYLRFPYGAISRTTDQTATAANTATQITFDSNDFLNGMTNPGSDGITVAQSGIYNYQFSLQMVNTDNAQQDATVWLAKSGTAIAGTGSKFTVPARKTALIHGYIIAACNFYVSLQAGDSVELWWEATAVKTSAPTDGIYLEAYTASAPVPSIPSAVATLSFVSALPTVA